MTTVTTIKSGIEARLLISLPTYDKLSYGVDVEMNKFKGNNKGYSVVPGALNEVSGITGSFVIDQIFKITLMDSYNEGAKGQLSDDLKASKIATLMDDAIISYKDLTINKTSVDSGILLIGDLSIDEAEFVSKEKSIKIEFTVNVKYKIAK